MIVRIALVEDENDAAQTIMDYLARYEQENQIRFEVTRFANAIAFLGNYKAAYDIVFMDIRMPYMDGMDAAHRLRALDSQVILIFITSLTQYAVAGYEVDALDYIVKPVNYYNFAMKLTRAVDRVPDAPETRWITLTSDVGKLRLAADDILYVETDGHHVIYHTLSGDHRQYASLSSVENELSGGDFARCNSCYLVNLRHVQSTKGYTVRLDGCELKISQPKKKSFLAALADWQAKQSG